MEIEKKLRLSHDLLYELQGMIGKLDADKDDIVDIIARAQHARLKMKAFFVERELPQLLEQIELLDSIIIRLQDMHNKRGMK
jgi:hypothetical protein